MTPRFAKKIAFALGASLFLTGCKDCGRDERKTSSPPAPASTDAHSLIAAHDGLPTITRWPPQGPPPHRAILLVHGGGGPELLHNRWMRPYTEALTAAGYDVYMPHYFEMKLSPEIEIARATLTFIAEQPGVAANRIGAVGFSRGGFIALETASVDERIKAAVEFYGGMNREAASKMTRMPPTLILHGDKDPTVRVENAHELHDSVTRMVTFLDARL